MPRDSPSSPSIMKRIGSLASSLNLSGSPTKSPRKSTSKSTSKTSDSHAEVGLDVETREYLRAPEVPENKTLFQAFEWDLPADQKHYDRLTDAIPQLKAMGIDKIWLPPGCKAAEPHGNGYDIYDPYDLGEFAKEWHPNAGTKFGDKASLIRLTAAAKQYSVGLVWDAVINHRTGAERKEVCQAVEVSGQSEFMSRL